MSPAAPAPVFSDDATLREVRRGFAAAAYDEPSLCGRLGCAAWTDLDAHGTVAIARMARAFRPSTGMLFDLFALRSEVPAAEVGQALGSAFAEALLRCRLLERAGDRLHAAVTLTPMGRRLICADRLERHAARAADFVPGPGGVTRHLADLALPGSVPALLDLGCGAGTLGILTAHRAERVVATDVNPRAVAFARFNTALNGLTNVTVLEGDLFEPVGESQFDLVLCNPPYALAPDSTFTYRDGGGQICATIARQVPRHLTEQGTLLMLAEWPERGEASWKEEIAGWLRDVACDAWALRMRSDGIDAYASRWLVQEYGDHVPTDAFSRWMSHLEGLGVATVGGGLVVVRRARHARPIRELRDAPHIGSSAGRSLERWLAGQDLLADLEHEHDLLDIVLVPAEGLELSTRRAPTGQGWGAGPPHLWVTTGLRFGARTDPVAAELIGWMDGRRTPREALSAVGAGLEVDPSLVEGRLPGALARLVALGILHPVERQR